MNIDHQFDKVLDDALAEYRDAEPLNGLDDRVLHRVREIQARPARWPVWTLTAGLAAALIVVLAWLGARSPASRPYEGQHDVQPTQASDAAKPSRPAPRLPSTRSQIASRPQRRYPVTTARSRTKHVPFPLPTPLSPAERGLLALARSNPQALQGLSRDRNEIAISPIEITPLPENWTGDQGED